MRCTTVGVTIARATKTKRQAQCIRSAHMYARCKITTPTPIMPDYRRALCPVRRGVITGIRPYARYQEATGTDLGPLKRGCGCDHRVPAPCLGLDGWMASGACADEGQQFENAEIESQTHGNLRPWPPAWQGGKGGMHDRLTTDDRCRRRRWVRSTRMLSRAQADGWLRLSALRCCFSMRPS